MPAVLRYDVSKSHAACGRGRGCIVVEQDKKTGFREVFAVSRVAGVITSVLYRQHFGTVFQDRTRPMGGVDGRSDVEQHKKPDFVCYSQYLAMH